MKPIIATTLAAALVTIALPSLADARGGNFLSQWDADGDGSVTLAEAIERRADMFAAFDTDASGALDGSELAAMDKASAGMKAAMQGDREQGKRGMGQRGQGHQGQKGQMQAQRGHDQGNHDHGQFDTDGDGLITLAEFTAGTESWFMGRDRNGDGALTSADFGPRH